MTGCLVVWIRAAIKVYSVIVGLRVYSGFIAGSNIILATSMSDLHLPPPTPFLPAPGEPVTPWKEWYSAFDTYILACDLSNCSDTRKKAILLHCLGTEGQRITRTLNLADALTFTQYTTKLQEHFAPQKSLTMERHYFRERVQNTGESIREFVAALRGLASKCKYGDLEEAMIRDQLTSKTRVHKIKERLLLEPDSTTLDKIINMACNIEEAMKESKAMGTASANTCATGDKQTDVHQVRGPPRRRSHGPKKVQTNVESTIRCTNCGENGHYPKTEACKAFNRRCRRCAKMHHFANVCMSSRNSRSPAGQGRSHGGQVQQVENDTYDEGERTKVHHIGPPKQFKTATVTIGTTSVQLLIDLGAKVSILNELQYKEHFANYKLHTPVQDLYTYSDAKISIVGMIYAPVQYGQQKEENHPFYISKHGSNLLGLDLFDKLNFKVVHDGVYIQTITNDTATSALAEKYPTQFSGFGKLQHYEHAPQVDSTVKPVSQSLRRLPFSIRQEVSSELKRLEQADIIEKIDSSPWISNLVVARRRNNELRLCIDLREVNKAIIPDKYPLPTMEELAAEFHGSAIYTKLDLRRSYLQVPLAEESRYLTAFVTHDGVFQYKRVPYGLSSAPSAFQKIMSCILEGLDGVLCMLDDVVIHARDQFTHDQRLDAVMSRLGTHNLTLNEEKCSTSQPEIEFLGYRVSKDGIYPTTSNVSAILDLPIPKNTHELQTFLGTTNFYSRFVPNYGDVVEPLRKLLRKDTPWAWSHEQDTAFRLLKEKIASPPVLAHFDPTADTCVTTDSSGVAMGAVMSQVINGVERPVAFASKTLSPTERKYSTSEREALACIFACEHWHMYLYGRRFVLRTDHRALTTLLDTNGSGHRPLRLYRWSDRLYQYNYKVEYTPKDKNRVADMLSRLGHESTMSPDKEDTDESQILAIMSEPLCHVQLTMDELTRESTKDTTIQQLCTYTQTGWPGKIPQELQPYARCKDELSVYNSCCLARGTRSVIPVNLRPQVLKMAHDGHPGVVRMKQKCREAVWWPGIDHDIERYVKDCEPCVISGKSTKPVPAPLQPIPWPEKPWHHLQIDIFGEVQIAPQNKRFLIVMYDLHSKWPEIATAGTVTSRSIINVLEDLFTRWGLVKIIQTDNGPQFTSHEFSEFLKLHGIEHRRSARYAPESQGGVERFNRVIKEGLKTHLAEGKTFDQAIQSILRNYRATKHALTNMTPAELMIGRNICLPLDRLAPPKDDVGRSAAPKAVDIAAKQRKYKDYVDQKSNNAPPNFKVGDIVRVKTPIRGHKLSSDLSVPFKIIKCAGKHSYQLENGSYWNARRLVRARDAHYQSVRSNDESCSFDDVDFEVNAEGNLDNIVNADAVNIHNRPQRVRQPPTYLNDYVT